MVEQATFLLPKVEFENMVMSMLIINPGLELPFILFSVFDPLYLPVITSFFISASNNPSAGEPSYEALRDKVLKNEAKINTLQRLASKRCVAVHTDRAFRHRFPFCMFKLISTLTLAWL